MKKVNWSRSKPDLTRMDLNVFAFLNSEDVEMMDANDVGQYVLTLMKAWAIGKNATLPNDREFLAKITRTTVGGLSEKMLAKWKTKGDRLVNPRLSAEWKQAVRRSEQGRALANRRWGGNAKGNAKRIAKGTAQHALPNPYRTNPHQTDPTHPTNLEVVEVVEA